MSTLSAAELVAAQLRAERQDRPLATPGTRYRISSAMACARQIGFRLLDVPPDLPLPPATLAAFAMGDDWHALIQRAIVQQVGEWVDLEVPCHIPGTTIGGHADAVLWDHGVDGIATQARTVVEIKSVASFGFKLAVEGIDGGPAEGPKVEHVCQAAMYALALDATDLWIIYADKATGAIADWHLGMGDVVDDADGTGSTPRWLAVEEVNRLVGLDQTIGAGMLPGRWIPGYTQRVWDPDTDPGEVQKPPAAGTRGQPWQCRYCQWQPTCVEVGPGVVPPPNRLALDSTDEPPF
jgi:hypothetical protein